MPIIDIHIKFESYVNLIACILRGWWMGGYHVRGSESLPEMKQTNPITQTNQK